MAVTIWSGNKAKAITASVCRAMRMKISYTRQGYSVREVLPVVGLKVMCGDGVISVGVMQGCAIPSWKSYASSLECLPAVGT